MENFSFVQGQLRLLKMICVYQPIFRKLICLSILSVERTLSVSTVKVQYFQQGTFNRTSRSQMFFKIGALKDFTNITEKHLCWSLFLIKLQALRPAILLKTYSNIVDILQKFQNFFTKNDQWMLLPYIQNYYTLKSISIMQLLKRVQF